MTQEETDLLAEEMAEKAAKEAQRKAREEARKALHLASMALEDMAEACMMKASREPGHAQWALSASAEVDRIVEALGSPHGPQHER